MKLLSACLALALCAPLSLLAEGRLGQAAEETRKPDSPSAGTSSNSSSTDSSGACLEWTINGLLFLFVGPAQLSGDQWSDHQVHFPGQGRSADFGLGFWADASYNKGLKIASFGLETAWKRLEANASLGRLEEWPEAGDRDFFHVGKAELALRFVNTPAFKMRSGIGARGLFDANRGISAGGLSLSYGGEASLGPVLAKLDLGIGNYANAFAAEAKGTLGFVLGPLEIYGGYQNLDIGGIGLGGPLAGLKGRF